MSLSLPTEWRRRSGHSTEIFDFMAPSHFLLFVGLFRLCRTRFRLNGGVAVGFRWSTFGFSAPSQFPSLRRSHRALPNVSHSLPTEWWRRSGLLTEYSRLLSSTSFTISSSVSVTFSASILVGLFRLCRFHFQLNGSVATGFQRNTGLGRNTFGLSAFSSLCRSSVFSACVALASD